MIARGPLASFLNRARNVGGERWKSAASGALAWDTLPETSRPLLFVRRSDRLVARLKHLLYAWRFARQIDGIVCMVWPDPPKAIKAFYGDNYHPGLIFDLEAFRANGGSDQLVFLPGKTGWVEGGPTLNGAQFAAVRKNRFSRDLFAEPGLRFYEDRLVDLSFADEPRGRPWMDEEVRKLFRKLPLAADVIEGISRVKSALGGAPYSCVHFRAGDVYHMLREALPALIDGSLPESRRTLLLGHLVARSSPIEFYDEHVARLIDGGETILFSSDSPEILRHFEARYGAGRFVDLSVFQAKEPIQKAMIDFCMIGGSRTVLGSRGNFGAMAASLGGAALTVVSAAKETSITPDRAADLYYRQALELFGSYQPLPDGLAELIRFELAQHYTYLNRLADKQTLAEIDPRWKIHSRPQ